MNAGRELDALIATEIMEWSQRKYDKAWIKHGRHMRDYYDWKPSAPDGIADAWLVVGKLGEDGWSCNIIRHEADDNLCEFWGGKKGNPFWREIVNHQPSVPLAICLAALKAVK